MSTDNQPFRLPESALEELEIVENYEWGEGVTLTALLDWIKLVEDKYRPLQVDSRSSANFTERSFRHYQTMGCIDPPDRIGKRAMYGYRQYLQALVIRKLLWERIPSDKIANQMAGRSNQEYKQILFRGVDIVDESGSIIATEAIARPVQAPRSGVWTRHVIDSGIELHLGTDREKMTAAEIKQVLGEVERCLKGG